MPTKQVTLQSVVQDRKGSSLRVVHCPGALGSLNEALEGVPAKQRQRFLNFLDKSFERLANGDRLSGDTFVKEASLPGLPGRSTGNFWALKKIPIRAYCWYSVITRSVLYVSHYKHKKKDALANSDIEAVHHNFKELEG